MMHMCIMLHFSTLMYTKITYICNFLYTVILFPMPIPIIYVQYTHISKINVHFYSNNVVDHLATTYTNNFHRHPSPVRLRGAVRD